MSRSICLAQTMLCETLGDSALGDLRGEHLVHVSNCRRLRLFLVVRTAGLSKRCLWAAGGDVHFYLLKMDVVARCPQVSRTESCCPHDQEEAQAPAVRYVNLALALIPTSALSPDLSLSMVEARQLEWLKG